MVILYTADMNFHNSRLQLFYKILIVLVIAAILVTAFLHYQDHKERIESRIFFSYYEYISVVNRTIAMAFDPYSLFFKLNFKLRFLQDEQNRHLYIEEFFDAYTAYRDFSYITAVGYSNSPEFTDYREYNQQSAQWQGNADTAEQLSGNFQNINMEFPGKEIYYFPDRSRDMVYTFYQRVITEESLIISITVDISIFYDEVIIPLLRKLFQDYDLGIIPVSSLSQRQLDPVNFSEDFSYTFSIFNLFQTSADRTEWLIPLPKQVVNLIPEKDRFRATVSYMRDIHSWEDIHLLVDIQTNGKSIIAAMEQELMLNWLMGLLLLLSIGAAFIVLLFQLIKIRQQRYREKEFVASITHELKTPLTIIKSAADNLQRGAVPKERLNRYGQHLDEQTKRLTTMVEEILLFSQLESRNLKKAVLTAADPQQIIKEITADLSSLNDQNSIVLDITSLPHAAMLDVGSLAIIIRNLILNALLHAYPEGKGGVVKVAAWLKIPNKLVFSIEDEGSGISGSDQRKIFQPFYRTKSSKEQQIKGSGLGLFLASKKAKLMHGSLVVRSPYAHKSGEKSSGCRFVLQIPYIAPPQELEDHEEEGTSK